jgi:MoaA/NifB/PqqE/SkfB family radical SAM enzyme
MCVRRTWHEPVGSMPRVTWSALIDQLQQFSPLPTIHLSGYGEPMAHPDFLEIVRQMKAVGLRVEMTTNGTLLTAAKSAALIDLGLDALTVSIDSVRPETYEDIRWHSSFRQVIENLRQLHRLRLRRKGRHGKPEVGLAFVAMKRNVADLPALPQLATKVGAKRISVSNLVPHVPEMEQEILYKEALRACAFRASRWVPSLSLPKLDLGADTLAPLQGLFTSTASLSLLDVSLSGRNDYCRFAEEGYAALRWDGQVSPCLPLLHDHPLYMHGRRKDVSHYGLGNIRDKPLRDIWESAEFCDFRLKLRQFAYSPCTTCGGCERFVDNFEDCQANTFPTCGGCLWAQGFVQCP